MLSSIGESADDDEAMSSEELDGSVTYSFPVPSAADARHGIHPHCTQRIELRKSMSFYLYSIRNTSGSRDRQNEQLFSVS